MAAMLSGQPIFELSTVEAEMLGNALYDVAEEYGITLSGPRAVWIKLAAAVGMVYAPRAITIMQANSQKAKARQRPTMATTPEEVSNIVSGRFDFSGTPPMN